MTRQQFFPLFVIMLAAGMAGYFALPFEPPVYALVAVAAGAAIFAGLLSWRWQRAKHKATLLLVNAVFLGALWAQAMSYYQHEKWAAPPIPTSGAEIDIVARVIW